MEVYVASFAQLDTSGDLPEVGERHLELLCLWVVH